MDPQYGIHLSIKIRANSIGVDKIESTSRIIRDINNRLRNEEYKNICLSKIIQYLDMLMLQADDVKYSTLVYKKDKTRNLYLLNISLCAIDSGSFGEKFKGFCHSSTYQDVLSMRNSIYITMSKMDAKYVSCPDVIIDKDETRSLESIDG